MPLNTARPSAARRLALNVVLLAILGLAVLCAMALVRARRRAALAAAYVPNVVSPIRGFTPQSPAQYADGKFSPIAVFTGQVHGWPRWACLYTGSIRPTSARLALSVAQRLYNTAWTAMKTEPTGTAIQAVPIKPSGAAYIIQGRHLRQGGFAWTVTVVHGNVFRTFVYFGPQAETPRDAFNERFLQAAVFAWPA